VLAKRLEVLLSNQAPVAPSGLWRPHPFMTQERF
jgi:hypothetical protein